MSETIRWWLVLQLVAVPLLPICLAMFRRLPDRGYALSKPLALLLLGWLFWLLNSLQIIPNNPHGILLAFVPLLAVAGLLAWRERDELLDWLDEHWRYVVGIEALLLLAFVVAAWLRSYVGFIEHTEQPMDLMFLNASYQAEHFPPEDPWLSGHTVAYYYFGYLLVAMVGQLAAVPAEIAYNLGLAMTAALTVVAAFGVVYNLVHMRESTQPDAQPKTGEGASVVLPFNWKPPTFAAAGALMLAVMGNLVWLFVFASAYGIGGNGFYNWLDVQGLSADETRKGWYPDEFFGYFGATRIFQLNDVPNSPDDFRVITEFPMFSFILGDLHPHVMALPFVILVIGVALTLYRTREPLDVTFWLERPLLLAGAAIAIGALAFLNTWDIATMAFVLVAAAAVANFAQMRTEGRFAASEKRALTARPADEWLPALAIFGGALVLLLAGVWVAVAPSTNQAVFLIIGLAFVLALWAAYVSVDDWPAPIELVARTASFALPLLMLAVALYAPFYRSFTSQASGVLPVVTRDGVNTSGTRPVHLLLYWGPLFGVVLPFVLMRLLAARERLTPRVWGVAAAVPVAIVLAWALLFALVKVLGIEDAKPAFSFGTQVADRGTSWFTDIFIGAALACALVALWLEVTSDTEREERESPVFVLGLAATALLLILGTQFFYVSDVFNSRMNTVFKLYYAGWVLLALAGGFSLYYLASRWIEAGRPLPGGNETPWRVAWAALAVCVLGGAMLYPLGATANRTEGFDRDRRLDSLEAFPADEKQAFDWLMDTDDNQQFVIAEAVGGDYWVNDRYARVSMATGVASVLGWGGHEDQWRGGTSEARAGRFEDISALYRAPDMAKVSEIVSKYGITHIYVGDVERREYGGAALEKFDALPAVFESAACQSAETDPAAAERCVRIYHATGQSAAAEATQ